MLSTGNLRTVIIMRRPQVTQTTGKTLLTLLIFLDGLLCVKWPAVIASSSVTLKFLVHLIEIHAINLW